MYTESFQPRPAAEPDPAGLKNRVAEFLTSFHVSLVCAAPAVGSLFKRGIKPS